MIRIDLRLNVAALLAEFEAIRAVYPSVRSNAVYEGWSLLTASGDYRDGWQSGQMAYDAQGHVDPAKLAALMPVKETAHVKPTELCRGAFAAALEAVRVAGFSPYRARISVLAPGATLARHVDGPAGSGIRRLHIALRTAEDAVFRFDDNDIHMPADGAGYVFEATRPHAIVNGAAAERVHLFMGVL